MVSPIMRSRILGPFACALAVAGPFVFLVPAETDAGWHIALGRLVLREGVPRTNALSWKFGATPWYDTSWLWDLLSAVAQGRSESALPSELLTLAFLALTLWLLAVACAREGTAWVVPAVAILLVPRTVPRPLLASWAVLAAALAAQSRRERAVAVAAIALASNFHTGAAFGAFVLGLQCLEAWLRERKRADLLLAALAGLALLANPGFAQTPQILFEHLRIGEVVRLREFEPPSWATEPGIFVLLPLGALLALLRARQRPALLVATLVFGALALRTQRMVYEAELVLAPSLAFGLSALSLPWLRGALAAALVLLAGASHGVQRAALRFSTRWNEQLLPVRAARFLRAHSMGPPFFNGLRDGGYLDLTLGTSFFDGREFAVPAQALRDWQEAEKSRPAFQAWLRGLNVHWAIATRQRESLSGHGLLGGSADWALVYWDSASEVYVRRDVPRMAPLLALEYRAFQPGTASIAAPGIFAELDRYEETSPLEANTALVRCAAASRQGHADAAALCDAAAARNAEPALVAKARALHP